MPPTKSTRPTFTPTQVSTALLVAGLCLYMAAYKRDSDLIVVAAVLLVIAAMMHFTTRIVTEVRSVNRPADVAYDEGYEAGFDRGWREGHAAANPTIVKLVTDSEGGHAQIG